MAFNPADYPPHWKQFSAQIRFIRAQERCECQGQCGLHGGLKGQRRCVEVHRRKAVFAGGPVHLAVAHLCRCSPPCANPAHVIACCQRCHLRIDRYTHAAKRMVSQYPQIVLGPS